MQGLTLFLPRISRCDTALSSKYHFFTSHFYTTLSTSGPNAVASWTKRKKIQVFEKKLIFVPINRDLHWSLCVIVNPGALVSRGREPREEDDLSCMIFMDSLKMHDKDKVGKTIRGWLNNQWQRKHTEGGLVIDRKEPFSSSSFRLFNPQGKVVALSCTYMVR